MRSSYMNILEKKKADDAEALEAERLKQAKERKIHEAEMAAKQQLLAHK